MFQALSLSPIALPNTNTPQEAGRIEPTWATFAELVEWDQAAVRNVEQFLSSNADASLYTGNPIEPPVELPLGVIKARECVRLHQERRQGGGEAIAS